jgi:nucleoside diphosphate kinase
MNVEIVRNLLLPSALNRETLFSNRYDQLSLAQLEEIRMGKVIEIFERLAVSDAIERGQVTLAMIKPATPNLLGLGDLEAAKAIERSVRLPLEVVSNLAIIFDELAVDEFYGGGYQEERMRQAPPHTYKNLFPNRWQEFKALMMSGPTNVMLLYSESGGAISAWRTQVGNWDVEAKRQPATIRGRFAKDNYNGIVHGSDSPDAVTKELTVIKNHLLRLRSYCAQSFSLKQEDTTDVSPWSFIK